MKQQITGQFLFIFSIDLNPVAGVNWQKQILNYQLASIPAAQNPCYNSLKVAKQG